jgi:metal-responsive CopG/Arc/MetJ family transcriptional regulator
VDRNEPKRSVRLSVEVTADELAAIDDFQFATGCPSRSAAVRELLKIGMVSGQPTRLSRER